MAADSTDSTQHEETPIETDPFQLVINAIKNSGFDPDYDTINDFFNLNELN